MLTKRTSKGLVWIDLESPTQEELRTVEESYHLSPLVTHELASPTLKPKVDLYKEYIYLILHFPRLRGNKGGPQNQEIDFVIGKKFLITVRYGGSETLHYFGKVFEAHAVLHKSDFGPHAGFIFFRLLQKLYEALGHEVEATKETLQAIEERIFNHEEREMVVVLSRVGREMLTFRRALLQHRTVVESFEVAGRRFFGEDFGFHLRTLVGDYYRVDNSVETGMAFMKELRETNNSLVSTKQNEIMKVLTIMAFVTFPLSLIASIFGMNTSYTPLVGIHGDFWIIMGMMLLLTGVFFWFFKRKNWL